MKKLEAIQLLGGSVSQVADAIGIKSQAVSQWPDDLPPRLVDRVQAALWRLQQGQSPELVTQKAVADGSADSSFTHHATPQ